MKKMSNTFSQFYHRLHEVISYQNILCPLLHLLKASLTLNYSCCSLPYTIQSSFTMTVQNPQIHAAHTGSGSPDIVGGFGTFVESDEKWKEH